MLLYTHTLFAQNPAVHNPVALSPIVKSAAAPLVLPKLTPATMLSAELLPDDPSSSLQQQQTPTLAKVIPPTQTSVLSETDAERKVRQRQEAERQLKAEKSQRILGVMPNFNSVIGGEALPLTASQKWDLALHSSVDPFYFASAFLLAGFDEADDGHQGYHWGPKGYFKRAGANYADTVNGTLIGNALMPVLLHQDPRYFRQGTGRKSSRLLHAALSTIICKGDNGRTQFNYSNVIGNFVSGAISNTYYPSDETGLELTLANASTVTAEGALGAVFLEFAPDLQKRLHRKRALKD